MPNIVKIETEEELVRTTAELIHVLVNLRFWSKYWHDNFGASAKLKKVYWEERADVLLRKLNLDVHDRVKPVKIIRDEK